MRGLALVLQCAAIAFAIFLIYQVSLGFYTQEFKVLDVVADVGTILICIDLAVFLWHSRQTKAANLQDYAQKIEQSVPKFVKISRKLGHLGILLILTSWIVPMING